MPPIVAGVREGRRGARRYPSTRPAWYSGHISSPGADNPAVGDQAVPAGQTGAPQKGIEPMLRLQAPLPDRYTLATPADLEEWIRAAKATLGDRLLILGHHYQRPEVIRWADQRGDSFKL